MHVLALFTTANIHSLLNTELTLASSSPLCCERSKSFQMNPPQFRRSAPYLSFLYKLLNNLVSTFSKINFAEIIIFIETLSLLSACSLYKIVSQKQIFVRGLRQAIRRLPLYIGSSASITKFQKEIKNLAGHKATELSTVTLFIDVTHKMSPDFFNL